MREITVNFHITQALWPGDGVFCTRVSAPKMVPDQFFLVHRDDSVSELRRYRFGTLAPEAPNVRLR